MRQVIAERCDIPVTQRTNLADAFPEIITYDKGVYRFTKFGILVFIPLRCNGRTKIRLMEPEGHETQASLETTGILIVSGAFDLVVLSGECTLIAFGYGKSVISPEGAQNELWYHSLGNTLSMKTGSGNGKYSLIGMGSGLANISSMYSKPEIWELLVDKSSSMNMGSAEDKYSLIWVGLGKANKSSIKVKPGNWDSLIESPNCTSEWL